MGLAAELASKAAPFWPPYFQTRGEPERNALIEVYVPLVEYAARRLHSKLPRAVDIEDLIQWGTFGLIDAINKFNPARKVKFGTFSAPRIRGAMVDGLRRVATRGRLTMDRNRKLLTAENELINRLGRPPTPGETAARLKKNPKQYGRMEDSRHLQHRSLQTVVERDDLRCVTIGDLLVDPRSRDIAANTEAEEVMAYVVRNFKVTEALVLRLYYFEGERTEDIAKLFGVSGARIVQIHQHTLQRLRFHLRAAA